MADNYSPEDLQRIQAEYAYHLEKGIPISKELATEFKNAQIGIKNYTQELNKSFSQLGNGVLNTAAALKDGAQGSSVFNQNIKDGADVLAKFLERIPYVGKALAALAKGASTYAVEANKQSDALYKSYQELSRFGQATSSGMDDVFSTMQKFSYGIGELDQMTALLRDNAKSLALFGGTVAQGTERIANTANDFKESGLQEYFLKMGASVDTQNRAIAGYAKQLTNFGQAQGKTQAELTKGAADYLRQMEGLTRLTGQTREEMEQQREQAMAVDQFAAVVSELDPKAAAEVQATFDILMKLDPAKARAFAESVSGFLTGSKEQNQLFQSSGGKLLGVVDGLKKGTMRAGEAVDQMFPKGKALEFQRQLAKMGTGADFMGGFSGSLKANNQSMKEAQETAEGQTAVTGELTDAAVDLRQSQMKTRDALQAMINDGVLPATKAMAALAGITEKAADGSKSLWDKFWGGLGDITGIGPGSKPGSGGGAPPPLKQDQGQNLELIKSALAKQGITDTKYVAATLGNVMKETQGRSVAENLDYRKTDNKRIQEIFGSRVAGKSASEIDQMKSSPENFGEAMYGAKTDIGRRMGNMEPGDGWKYRGRGFIQLTGKSNYAEASRAIYGDDRLVKDPDLVLQPLVAAEVTAWYMKKTQGMAKGMGIDINNMSQEQANVLATSQVAGRDVRKAGGYLGGENLDKVNRYAAQQLKTTTPASAPTTATATTTTPDRDAAKTTPTTPPVVATPVAKTTPTTPPVVATPVAKTTPTTPPVVATPVAKAPPAIPDPVPTKTTVSGNLAMGKPSGPIEYNGKTVKPGDPTYADASKALVASMEKIDSAKRRAQEARANIAQESRNNQPAPVAAPTPTPTTVASDKIPTTTAPDRDVAAMAKITAQQQKQMGATMSMAKGFDGILSGPASGYKPDITMHGTEQLKVTPIDKASQPATSGMDTTIMSQQLSKMDQLVQAFNNTSTQDMMAMQLSKLDELVRVMQNQVNVSTKILQQSR
jgi:predicted chitinase